jgi:hypothetical protein
MFTGTNISTPVLNYVNKYYAVKEVVCGSGDIAPPFLISALDEGEWSASRPSRFTPVEVTLGTHWVRS